MDARSRVVPKPFRLRCQRDRGCGCRVHSHCAGSGIQQFTQLILRKLLFLEGC